GTYYVWVIADNFGKVTNQSDTTNDLQHSIDRKSAVYGQRAWHRRRRGITLGARSVAPGAARPVSWSLLKQGSAATSSTGTSERRITSAPSSAAGTELLGISTAAMGASALAGHNATVTAPTTPGTYYVWVIADNFGKVTNQSDTTNDLQHSIAFRSEERRVGKEDMSRRAPSQWETKVAPGASLPGSCSRRKQG